MGCVTFEDRLPTMPTAPKKLPAKASATPAPTQATAPLPAANFPARLIQTRRQASMTQQALADAAGVHVNQIKRYEAGAAQPTLEALFFGHVDHVEREDGGQSQFQNLRGEVQIALKICSVGDHHNNLRRRGVRLPAQQHIARNDFIRGTGLQAVAPGEIDNRKSFAVSPKTEALLFFDCDTRVIPDLLAHACECIEDRGLSAIRIASDGNSPWVSGRGVWVLRFHCLESALVLCKND